MCPRPSWQPETEMVREFFLFLLSGIENQLVSMLPFSMDIISLKHNFRWRHRGWHDFETDVERDGVLNFIRRHGHFHMVVALEVSSARQRLRHNKRLIS